MALRHSYGSPTSTTTVKLCAERRIIEPHDGMVCDVLSHIDVYAYKLFTACWRWNLKIYMITHKKIKLEKGH